MLAVLARIPNYYTAYTCATISVGNSSHKHLVFIDLESYLIFKNNQN